MKALKHFWKSGNQSSKASDFWKRGHSDMSSELVRESWAVISDRGCEATGLTHEDARRLVHRLAGDGRHGLCIISDEAASRLGTDNVKAGSPRDAPTVLS